MIYLNNTRNLSLPGDSVVTLGKFDGMHLGHQLLMERVLEISKERRLISCLFTFEVSPGLMTRTDYDGSILTNEERVLYMRSSCLDYLVEYPFDEAVMNQEAGDFVREVLVGRLHAKAVVVGTDFRFGHKRKGDPGLLMALGERYGFSVEVIPKKLYRGEEISSTRIRSRIREGEMKEAALMLGFPYFFRGEVIHGRALGHTLGIPTTNLRLPKEKVLPPFGVYITRNTFRGEEFYGITNLGVKPTVKGDFVGLETHLLSCNLNLYGQTQHCELLEYLRPEIRFADLNALKAQILADKQAALQYRFEHAPRYKA